MDNLKTKNRATVWPYNPTSGHISREKHGLKGYIHPVFTEALFTVARTWKQPRCLSIDEWIQKLWFICTLSHKKEWNSVICGNIAEPRDCQLWINYLYQIEKREINIWKIRRLGEKARKSQEVIWSPWQW